MIYSKYYTAATAMNISFDPKVTVGILEVRLKLSAAGGTAEPFTISLDSNAGVAYDVEIDKAASMESLSNYIYKPSKATVIRKGDKLKLVYTNTNSRTYGIEIVYYTIPS